MPLGPGRLSHARCEGRRALCRQGAQPEEARRRLHPAGPPARAAAADGERDRLDGDRHHPHRGRGAAARGQPHQAAEAALQHRAARRQVLSVADADRGPPVPADRQASRRADPQGELLGAVRLGLGGEPDRHRHAARVPAALLRRHGVRQPHAARACCTRSGAARRPASAASTRPATRKLVAPGAGLPRRQAPPPCSRSSPPRWSAPPRRWSSSAPPRCATASAA